MSSALVLGERGSGLTTFVGLLYTAQVRLGTEESDEFRFHAERESIRQLEAIYGELGAGRFPPRDGNGEERPLAFVFGFRHGRLRGLGHHREEPESGFDTVEVRVAGMQTESLDELRGHDAVLDSATRRSFRSQVVVPLIDASALSADPDRGAEPIVSRHDRQLAGTLAYLSAFLAAERERRARRMYPLFVVTKADTLELDTLRRLNAPSGIPSDWPADGRRALGARLLRTFFPQTAQFLDGPRPRTGVSIAPAEWYFSSLGTERVGRERRVQRRSRAPVGGWEPVYPFEEYRSLIETLGRIARRTPVESAD